MDQVQQVVLVVQVEVDQVEKMHLLQNVMEQPTLGVAVVEILMVKISQQQVLEELGVAELLLLDTNINNIYVFTKI